MNATTAVKQHTQATESYFDIAELFYSCTNARGIVLSGNDVFQRVSHYEWDELIGAPHKVIRHPDMPKAVFFLLWKTIQSGNLIGAYVKNRAKNGAYYWVYAVVSPVDEGYLSVRMKPTSPVLGVVKGLYAEILTAEKAQGLNPEESADLLLERLDELGFPTYEDFMAQALATEISARNDALALPQVTPIRRLEGLKKCLADIKSEIDTLAHSFHVIHLTTINLRIYAARFEKNAGALGAISENYNVLSALTTEKLEHFQQGFEEVENAVRDALLLGSVATLQTEAADQMDDTSMPEDFVDADQERARLQQLDTTYRDRAMDSLNVILHAATSFMASTDEIVRLAGALDAVRISCGVESTTLSKNDESIKEVVTRLETFNARIDQSITKVAYLNMELHLGAKKLVRAANSTLDF